MDKRAVAKYETREEVADRLGGKSAGQNSREGDAPQESDWYKAKIIELLEHTSEREAILTYQFLKSIKK